MNHKLYHEIRSFGLYLRQEERAKGTVEKYLRDQIGRAHV